MTWKEKLQRLVHSGSQGTSSTETRPVGPAVTVKLPQSGDPDPSEPIWQRRYKIVRPLGEGGMGKAVLAERRSDSGLVCLKFLNTETDRRTAEQECRALLRLRHPSIVALVDFSFEDKSPWLATEYVAGSTLQKYLKEHAPLPLERVLAILKTMLEALEYAHGEAVIHRDLKPANLMIEVDGDRVRVRILDFGIAIIDEYDHEGRITAVGADPLGTLLYMAPEQLDGRMLTPACDIYAVGLMAWEALMGQSVFAGKSRSQMMFEKVTRTKGFDFGDAAARFPAGLGSFVEACTRADPGSRPAAREGLVTLQAL